MDNDIHPDQIGAVPICASCGSERVVKEALACFNPEYGLWELETVRDRAFCPVCGGEVALSPGAGLLQDLTGPSGLGPHPLGRGALGLLPGGRAVDHDDGSFHCSAGCGG